MGDSSEARRRVLRPRDPVVHLVDDVSESDKIRAQARITLREVGSHTEVRIPMLPRVAARAMQVANDPKTSIRELIAVIQPDPMLTAQFLSIANSSLFGGNSSVTSLRNAIQRLGVDRIRDILYQAVAEAHIFHGKAAKKLRWERLHAVAMAYITREVWAELGSDTSYAFLCGLLHDVGRCVLLEHLDLHPLESFDEEEIEELIFLIHTQIGKIVCRRWELPALTWEAARRHHRYRDYAGRDSYSQTGHILAVAERLALHVGLGEEHGEVVPIDLEREGILWELGFDAAQIEKLLTKSAELAEQIRS